MQPRERGGSYSLGLEYIKLSSNTLHDRVSQAAPELPRLCKPTVRCFRSHAIHVCWQRAPGQLRPGRHEALLLHGENLPSAADSLTRTAMLWLWLLLLPEVPTAVATITSSRSITATVVIIILVVVVACS